MYSLWKTHYSAIHSFSAIWRTSRFFPKEELILESTSASTLYQKSCYNKATHYESLVYKINKIIIIVIYYH